jgi:hypothetical protein
MIGIRKTIGGNTQTHWASLRDAPPRQGADVSKPGDAENDADEMYPAEFLPVGDPRPRSE